MQIRPFKERIRDPLYWRNRIVEGVLAVMAVYVITSGIVYQEREAKAAIPASDWFQVYELYVPDFKSGENPEVIYDREVKVSFNAFRIVEVQRRDDSMKGLGPFSNVCTGAGVHSYIAHQIVDRTMTWEALIGRDCRIPPGEYRLVLTKDMTVPGYPVKRSHVVSNVFRVRGR